MGIKVFKRETLSPQEAKLKLAVDNYNNALKELSKRALEFGTVISEQGLMTSDKIANAVTSMATLHSRARLNFDDLRGKANEQKDTQH